MESRTADCVLAATNDDEAPKRTEPPPRSPLEFDETSLIVRSSRPGELGAVIRVLGPKARPSEFRLTSGTCIVGSAPEADIVIEDRTVSRRHVKLELAQDAVRVTDLGSRNGTTYLGQRFDSMLLSLGARVTVGNAILVFDPDTEALYAGLEYEGDSYRGVLGVSVEMRGLFALLSRLERSLATVLIEGESGTGKERVARAIHNGSPVAKGPLVTVNCGALTRHLVESELFGHRRGAFTGAIEQRRGAFECADRGTLFLDEVGELPLEVQPALLRAIETGEVRPVGDDRTRQVKVRLIAATNRDLSAEVAAGRFREDLYFRLAVVRIQVPPLRGRPADVEVLANHFAESLGVASLPRALMEELKARTWRGNARQLRNAIQSYAAVGELPCDSDNQVLSLEGALQSVVDASRPYAEQKEAIVEQFTKVYLKALMRRVRGNQSAAARIAELDRSYLGRLLARHGLLGRAGERE